ncbi:MAG: citrate lyase subunit alpha [Acholeplasmataceae bacterium]|nr:citrate lyase subunit alpha [Acholeplasmataceae bacterium]
MIKNGVGRWIPKSYTPFVSDDDFKSKKRKQVKKASSGETIFLQSLSEVFNKLNIKDGMTLSFHHHYRNGDHLLNMVAKEIVKRNLKNITLAPSGIFPVHEPIIPLLLNKNVTQIVTNYVSGPVAESISRGDLEKVLIMDTHGGRARAIEAGDLNIDIAFIAASAVDKKGNANGVDGKNPCGPLGYIIPDVLYAKHKVVVTDTIVSSLTTTEINGNDVDYVVTVNAIGDSSGIETGTTQMTRDPVQLKIARDTVRLLKDLDVIQNGFSFQTGAGATSIAVSHYLKDEMEKRQLKGRFVSGGITAKIVELFESSYFAELYDVQSFDLTAVNSYKNNQKHHFMDASLYANPFEPNNIARQLDVVILGAAEVDLDFNVNVTTSSTHQLIGGSGGHSDTAYEAKLTVITTNLFKSRIPFIRQRVQTVSTPGSSVDVVVTERGIAINPKRTDLIEKLKDSQLNIVTIDELYQLVTQITGQPKSISTSDKIIGLIRYRDGTIIDTIREVKK